MYKFWGKNRKCEDCKNYKTMKCPNSFECYATDNKPFFEKKEKKND